MCWKQEPGKWDQRGRGEHEAALTGREKGEYTGESEERKTKYAYVV